MIIKHKASGLMCWTGTIITPQEAAGRIIEKLNQQLKQEEKR